jgi:nitronate monooxygenase
LSHQSSRLRWQAPSHPKWELQYWKQEGLALFLARCSRQSRCGRSLGSSAKRTLRPINVNFFCHQPPKLDPSREQAWKHGLSDYYIELGLDPSAAAPASIRMPFDSIACELVEEFKPQVVSFHFGLPEETLLDRVKATSATIISPATSVDDARWLEAHGCDAIIAQGYEAGRHRGTFLSDDITRQAGTMALVPQIVDAVQVPVIAAGGIMDGRGIAAAIALGASAVQMGTAYLFCSEANVSPIHRQSLRTAKDNGTALTNVFTGRPARGIVNRRVREVGPMSNLSPEFPTAGGAIAPLRNAAGASGVGRVFSPLVRAGSGARARDAR